VIDEKKNVNGKGTDSAAARWVVYVIDAKDPNKPLCRFENVANPGHFLRISADKKTDSCGHKAGEYTELFVVPHANGNVSLQSRVWGDGRYGTSDWNVGVMPNGDVKDPTQTGKGEHGQFKPIFRASLSMKTGRIVQLRCHARPSHTLRIAPENKDKDVEQDGGAGEWAQWKLTVTNDNFWQPTIQLENIKVTGHYLRITDGKVLNGAGHSKGEFTFFHVIDHPDGSFSLRSEAWARKEEASYHVGFAENGQKKDPTQLKAHEPHAKFDLLILS